MKFFKESENGYDKIQSRCPTQRAADKWDAAR
jgi:hypothetical protein